MSNYNYDMKRKAASELIEKAVIIKRAKSPDDIKKIDSQREMSLYVGTALVDLLTKHKSKEEIGFQDWASQIYDYEYLMISLLVLLASPKVLEKLDSSVQKTIATKINKLLYFFKTINEGFTLEWLDHVLVTQYHPEEAVLDRMIERYSFSNVDTPDGNFFSFDYRIHKKRYEKMKEIFVSLNSKELLSGK